MMKVKVIKPGYGHKEGQILELGETDAGHLMAFGYAIPYVAPKVETRPVAPPEIRFRPLQHQEQEPEIVAPPIVQEPEPIEPKKPSGLFGRRGRKGRHKMSLTRTTAPGTYCVSIDEVKNFLRLTTSSSDEDAMLIAFIKAAESYGENYMKRAIMSQTWELRLDDFPGHDDDIELPRPPLTTVSSNVTISYVEDSTTGNTTAVPSTAYTIDYYSAPGIVYPSYDNEWPDPRDEKNAVRITYVCGYTTPGDVPESIRHWVKLRVGAMYEHRESLMVGTGNFVTELPYSFVDGLLGQFVIPSV